MFSWMVDMVGNCSKTNSRQYFVKSREPRRCKRHNPDWLQEVEILKESLGRDGTRQRCG